MKRILSATLASCLISFSLASAAQADHSLPALTDPVNGATVPAGYTGPLSVDRSHIPEGVTLRVTLNCGSQGDDLVVRDMTTSTEPDVFDVPALSGSQGCVLASQDQDPPPGQGGYAEFATFDVAAPPLPPLALSQASISATSFYPRVRDGYRDNVRVSWTSNRAAATSASVRNAAGRIVRTQASAGLLAVRTRGRGTGV